MLEITLSRLRREAEALRQNPLEVLLRWGQEGPAWEVKLPFQRAYLLFAPEPVEAVLLSRDVTKETFQYRALGRLTGPGLLVSDGEKWRESRRLLNPPFSSKHRQAWQTRFAHIAEAFFDSWQAGEARDLEAGMMALSLQFLGEAFWGHPLEENLTETVIAALDHLVEGMQDPLLALNPRRYWRWRRLKKRLSEAAHLLAQHPTLAKLAPAQARAEALTLLIAGHETLGSALTWSLYLLSHHPHYFANVAEDYTWAQLVFHEALRLYPPAWIITRRLRQPLSLGQVQLRPGSLVILSPYITHRLSFPDGEAFQPERFLTERAEPSGRYFPFGLGPRLCIGRDMSLIEGPVALQAFAQRFRLEPLPDPGLWPSVTLRTRNGLPARLLKTTPD